MGYELEKAESRLSNIRKVQPILAALRTISIGSWQIARNRHAGLERYTQRLRRLLPVVLPKVARPSRLLGGRKRARQDKDSDGRAQVLLVIGSERGLCGRYNKALVAQLEAQLAEADREITLLALGSRMVRELRLAGHAPSWSQALSVTTLPPYTLAHDLVRDWLARYEAYELDSVDVLYNADQGAGSYAPEAVRLIPPAAVGGPPTAVEGSPGVASPDDVGILPPLPDYTIVDTDPMRLYIRIVEQWTAIAMYRLLLEAATTEHFARYQLMESATQNAESLINELLQTVQSARRQSITREMQELAIGAGLLSDEAD